MTRLNQELWDVILDLVRRHNKDPMTNHERASLMQHMRELTDKNLSLDEFFSMPLDKFFERHDHHNTERSRELRLGFFRNLGIMYLGELLLVYRVGQLKNHYAIVKRILERVLRKPLSELTEAVLDWKPAYWNDPDFLQALQNPLRNSSLSPSILNGLYQSEVFLYGELLKRTEGDSVSVFLNNTQRLLALANNIPPLRAGMIVPPGWQPNYPEEVLIIKESSNTLQVLERLKQEAEVNRRKHVSQGTSPSSEMSAEMFALLCEECQDHLSVRAATVLNNNGIVIVGQLIRTHRETLIAFRGCGAGTINEIEAELEKHGLSLGMDLPAEVISLFPL